MTDFSHSRIAAGNRHRAFSFDRAMKFGHYYCSQRQAPVAVPELWRHLPHLCVSNTSSLKVLR